jgi:hypothetical protein
MGFYKASQSIPFDTINWKAIIISSCLLIGLGFLNFLNNWNIYFAQFLSIESLSTQTIKSFLSTLFFVIIQSGFYSIILFYCLNSRRPTYLWKKVKTSQIKGFWNICKNEWSQNSRYIIPSVSAGTLLICLLFFAKNLTQTMAPFISNLSYQQAYFPSFAIAHHSLMTFLFFSFILILTDYAIAFVTDEWKKNYFLGFLISCILGFIIALNIAIFSPITLYSLILYGILFGIGFIMMYHLITRYDRFNFLLIAQMLTILAIHTTLPFAYKLIVVYCASAMMQWCHAIILQQRSE